MVIERESEAEEHRLVASTLTKSDENKKAWRLVGVRLERSFHRVRSGTNTLIAVIRFYSFRTSWSKELLATC